MILRMKWLIPVALAGVAAAPATAQGNTSAPAAIALPPAGKGQIVFFRAEARGVGCLVREGEGAAEQRLSKLTNNRFFIHTAEPGKHTYWAKNFSKDAVALEIEPGETYYVRCTVAIGMMAANPNLGPSSEAEFKLAMPKLKPMEK